MAGQQRTNIWIDGSQAGSTLTELKKKVNALNREIKDLPRNSDKYNAKVKELAQANGALDNHRKAIRGVGDSYAPAKSNIGGLISKFAPMAGGLAIVGAAIGAVVSGVTSWYQNNKQMEKSLSSLRSLTGASAEDIKFYKKEAIEMGKTSTMSASQVVEGFKLIGSARPELLKDKEALAAVTKEAIVLSEAAEMDLGASAQSLAGSMNQFNLGAEHSARIINALAAGAKEGAAEISDQTASIEKFGTVAAANNVTFEESVALTQLMAEKNIKNSEAGTQLRNVLLTVATASALPREAIQAVQQYGVDLSIVTNKALPLKDRLKELSKVQGDQNALVRIFGKENVTAGQTILGQVDKFNTLTNAVTGTNTAYVQQAINNDNLDGDLKKMASSWEGLTLSIGGGGEIMREFVQSGTGVIDWASNTITAFKEWDTTKMETSFLQLAKVIPGVGLLFGDYLDEMIRHNQLVSGVIDGMKDEANAAHVLVGSLDQNNQRLRDGNITAEERASIQAENVRIIDELNQKYPELTSEMDLQSASSKELSKLQKDINENLLQQSINAAKAAEAERLLGEIVKTSISIAEQRAKENKRWAVTNWVADVFADDAEDLKEQQQKFQKQLVELPETFKQVEKDIREFAPEFGVAFKENTKMISEATKEIRRLKKLLKTADSEGEQASVNAQIKAQRQIIAQFKERINEQKEGALKQKEIQEQQQQDRQAALKKSIEDRKRMEEDLTRIIESAKKIQLDLEFNRKLNAISDEQQKELLLLAKHLDEKYDSEIKSAQKLANDKTDIGRRAAEQIALLESLKAQESADEQARINEKYRRDQLAADYEAQKDANLQYLKQQETLRDAEINLRVLKAKVAIDAVRQGDLSGYRKAKDDLENALREEAELQKQRKLEALMDQQDEGTINLQEFNLRKEALEVEHQQNLVNLAKQSSEELKKIDDQRLQSSIEAMSQILDIGKQFSDAAANTELKNINSTKAAEMESIEARKNKKIITEEEYQKQKKQIDNDYAQKKYEIDKAQFERDRAFAIANALVNGALGATKAIGQTGIGAAFAIPLIFAATTAQIATILSQQPPEAPVTQMYEGGFTDVIGAKDGLRYRARNKRRLRAGLTPPDPTLALVSEKGPEYFVPNGLLRNQRVARHVAMIDAIRTNQFAAGGFTSAADTGSMDSFEVALRENTAASRTLAATLPHLQVVFTDRNIEDLQDQQDRLTNVKG